MDRSYWILHLQYGYTKEATVHGGYGLVQTRGEFRPGPASVSFKGNIQRLESGSIKASLEVRIELNSPTLGVGHGESRGVRTHEETHQSLTTTAYESIGPELSRFESTTFESVEDMREAAGSQEARSVLTAAADLARACSDVANLQFDLDDEQNTTVTQSDVDEAQERVEAARTALTGAIDAFVDKYEPQPEQTPDAANNQQNQTPPNEEPREDETN